MTAGFPGRAWEIFHAEPHSFFPRAGMGGNFGI